MGDSNRPVRAPEGGPRRLFVTGTDTGVGKTEVACLIAREARAAGLRVGVCKPVCSGAELRHGQPEWEDIRRLADAAGLPGLDEAAWPKPEIKSWRDRICPQRFLAAAAPNVAAREEGRRVDGDLLRSAVLDWSGHCDLLIVEGAGGLLSPLSDSESNADFALWLQAPVLVVARLTLGTINHTLLTLAALEGLGLPVAGVVLSDVDRSADSLPGRTNPAELQCWLKPGTPLLGRLPFEGQSLWLPTEDRPTRIDWHLLSEGPPR